MSRRQDLVRQLAARFVLVAWLAASSAVHAQPAKLTDLDVVAHLEQSVSAAIAAAERSVVAVARVRNSDLESEYLQSFALADRSAPGEPDFVPNEYASGVVVDSDGLILTNSHVLRDVAVNEYYVTTLERKTYSARVLASDPRSDLAVLRIDASGLRAVKFGDASNVRRGQFVVALGNPLGIARDGQVSASFGIVSNLARKARPSALPEVDPLTNAPVVKATLHHYGTLIQTDANLEEGASGGMLVNMRGEMVGLTTAAAAVSGQANAGGFAIPVDETFRRALEQLKLGREVEYGFLGVAPAALAPSSRTRGLAGVKVERVFPGTPAAQAGLRDNDIVTHVGERPVRDTDEFFLAVGRLPPSTEIGLGVVRSRSGRAETLQAKLIKYRAPINGVATDRGPIWRGIRVDYPSAVLALRAGDAVPTNCVIVVTAAEDSAAWSAGVRPGMLIAKLNGESTATPADFHDLAAKAAASVALEVVGGGEIFTIPE